MLAFMLRRLLAVLPVMLVVALFVFLLLHLSPGDPAQVLAGDQATPEQVAEIRRAMRLDDPLHLQFFEWMGRILAGDLGQSLFSRLPVAELLGQRLQPSIALAISTTLLSVAVGVPLGLVAAWRAGSWIDRAVMAVASAGFSIPIFVVAFSLIWAFGLKLQWLPIQGFVPLEKDVGAFLRSLVLPTITLSTVYLALIARITRASLVEVLREDFVRTAHAKGASERRVVLRHGLRNAAVPILTVIGMGFALLLGGVVVTENLFNIPGIGRLVAEAILKRDYPIIQSVVLLFAALYVLLNLVIDLLYVALDPRIRL